MMSDMCESGNLASCIWDGLESRADSFVLYNIDVNVNVKLASFPYD